MRKYEKVNGKWYKSPEEVNLEWIPPAGLLISVLTLVGYIVSNMI